MAITIARPITFAEFEQLPEPKGAYHELRHGEALPPSNPIPEIREKRKLCLANGSREFWLVDRDSREVEVWTPGGDAVTYRSGQEIPLFFAPGAKLRVDGIFA